MDADIDNAYNKNIGHREYRFNNYGSILFTGECILVDLYVITAVLALLGGFISGILGIGGGIVMAPLLLYVPPWFGCEPLSMRVVAGLTIVQALSACLVGALTHKKFECLSMPLTLWMGTTIFITALIGGAWSSLLPDAYLLAVFAVLSIIAVVLMVVPGKVGEERADLSRFTFSRGRAVQIAGSVGFLGGLVGQGGSFILIPLMTAWMRVPMRIAIGSNLAVVFLSSLAAFLGKVLSGRIEWPLAVCMIVAAIPAARLGALMSHRVPLRALRILLAICIAAAA
ncbi:MAG: sulfite exporter TauE/SafE family protein, partial [Desulfobulbaceae bacterium]|nr:sulfite exporter TauE/SafE family protein [Desulfobulbaceae bacterium]